MEKGFLPKIGLEIHVQLKTKTKMFCSCKNDPEEKVPNLNVCPICLGHPGTLPTVNEEAIKKVIKVGLALNCQIAEISKFDRKNYFYPDLPKGYQISQYDFPLCKEGFLEIEGKKIRIRRIHLEEDTGKLLHEKDASLVDFNRAGIPLMELVTEPDINSPKEAKKFAKELYLILRYLDVSEANMEKGQMRVEANVSLPGGSKVEIKNLNSFRALEQAIEFEVKRQKQILEKGGKVIQETRGWDDLKKITFSQREKEEAEDYRYFPEPDLFAFKIPKTWIKKIKSEIGELPAQKRERFEKEYFLDKKLVEFFVFNPKMGNYFENVVSELKEWLEAENKQEKFLEGIRLCANYLVSDLQGLMKEKKLQEIPILPENFAELICLRLKNEISSKLAKEILAEMFFTQKDPSQIIEEKGLRVERREQEVEKIIKEVIEENEKAVEDFKNGKEGALNFLVGKAMQKSKGKIDPQLATEFFKKFLLK